MIRNSLLALLLMPESTVFSYMSKCKELSRKVNVYKSQQNSRLMKVVVFYVQLNTISLMKTGSIYNLI